MHNVGKKCCTHKKSLGRPPIAPVVHKPETAKKERKKKKTDSAFL